MTSAAMMPPAAMMPRAGTAPKSGRRSARSPPTVALVRLSSTSLTAFKTDPLIQASACHLIVLLGLCELLPCVTNAGAPRAVVQSLRLAQQLDWRDHSADGDCPLPMLAMRALMICCDDRSAGADAGTALALSAENLCVAAISRAALRRAPEDEELAGLAIAPLLLMALHGADALHRVDSGSAGGGHAAGLEGAEPSTAGEFSLCSWNAASLKSETSGNMGSGDGGLWARRVCSLVRTSSMVAATGSPSFTSSRRLAASHFLHRRRRAPLASSAFENSARLCAAWQPKQVSSC